MMQILDCCYVYKGSYGSLNVYNWMCRYVRPVFADSVTYIEHHVTFIVNQSCIKHNTSTYCFASSLKSASTFLYIIYKILIICLLTVCTVIVV